MPCWYFLGCLSGPVVDANADLVNEEATIISNEYIYPLDKFVADTDLNLFDSDFVDAVLEANSSNRVIYENVTNSETGDVHRRFNNQTPRRLKDEISSKLLTSF